MQSAQRSGGKWWLLLAMLSSAAPVVAQTKFYNPIRRTSGTMEINSAQPEEVEMPTLETGEGWTPPVKGPPNQWRSIRQPGPVQLPSARHMSTRPGAPPAETAPAEVIEGEGHEEGPWNPAASHHGPDCGCGDSCDDGCCGDGCCTTGPNFGLCGGSCGNGLLSHVWNSGWGLPRSWQIFGGVHGFKGPPDQGHNGNFGFHEGFNLGGPLKPCWGLGYQFGGQFVHSNFAGDDVVGDRTEVRNQSFFTAGLFRRTCGCGLQGGVVWDILYDDYYLDMTLSQLRGELSYLIRCGWEFGFFFAAEIDDDFGSRDERIEEIWTPTDQYAFFLRRNFQGGSARGWAGWTGDGDGLLGADVNIPISRCWAFQSNFNWLIPEEGSPAGIPEESWAIGINLVWYPSGNAQCLSPCRPLFGVADNATFMIDRSQRLIAD